MSTVSRYVKAVTLNWTCGTDRVVVVSMVMLGIVTMGATLGIDITLNVYSQSKNASACPYLELIILSPARESVIDGVCILQIPTWFKPLWWKMAPHTLTVKITHPTSQGPAHGLWLYHRCTRWLQISAALPPYSQQKLVQCSVYESFSARLFCLLCIVSLIDIHIHTNIFINITHVEISWTTCWSRVWFCLHHPSSWHWEQAGQQWYLQSWPTTSS
jgi:hypothetical protein